MKSLFKTDEWQIIEEGFHPDINREAESVFAIGNGYMGQRANMEEKYSGDSLQGSYLAGIYYPDKTKVGWWKVGYPEYFAKVPNAPNWTGIGVQIDNTEIDLAKLKVENFRRVLNMKEGYLSREFTVLPGKGKRVHVQTFRFLSMAEPDLGIIRYKVSPLNFNATISFTPFINSDVRNEDTNFGEKFWKDVHSHSEDGFAYITARTLRTNFVATFAFTFELRKNGKRISPASEPLSRKSYVANRMQVSLKEGDELEIIKYVNVLSSLYLPADQHVAETRKRLGHAAGRGFGRLFSSHVKEWTRIWGTSDVEIEGDPAAQQGIRFNIFHLNQTYTGKDERLNIGPKGFTGEKYGGSTYWDTEAFVLPFFLKTAPMKVSRNLLLYRYKHLGKSIENARKLGFRGGAALYPMVTMNGEECHNEWEITFEEIHRNGAIAFAIFNYIRHTGDFGYMKSYGLEVLIALSRFWSQRVSFSENLGKFVILGVTGPNEYENNVNNNWYTNTIAAWTLSYTIENIGILRKKDPSSLSRIFSKTGFREGKEIRRWKEIIELMHFPRDEKRKIFLQQDGFLDKELKPASAIPAGQRPINQHWSWDRILRSCYIKQADVLQGIYFFEDRFDTDTIKRNFDFYEPITVHESSLSACIHSILAARTGNIGKAYELYLRTARLDLDDYNREVADGLHITSMAGTWLAIVEGFAGMRISGENIILKPLIPVKWKSYTFRARFRDNLFKVKVTRKWFEISNQSSTLLKFLYNGSRYEVPGRSEVRVNLQ